MAKKKTTDYFNLEEDRYGLFMNDKSFDLDIEYGREYLRSDVVHFIKLYKIDVVKSDKNELYGQAKPSEKKLFSPVKLNIMPQIDENDQYYYGDNEGGIVRDDTGKLTFGVYIKELKEKNTDIFRGDIVEYNISGEKNRFYEVEFANNVKDTTSKTIAGYKPYWRKIVCNPVKGDFTILND